PGWYITDVEGSAGCTQDGSRLPGIGRAPGEGRKIGTRVLFFGGLISKQDLYPQGRQSRCVHSPESSNLHIACIGIGSKRIGRRKTIAQQAQVVIRTISCVEIDLQRVRHLLRRHTDKRTEAFRQVWYRVTTCLRWRVGGNARRRQPTLQQQVTILSGYNAIVST